MNALSKKSGPSTDKTVGIETIKTHIVLSFRENKKHNTLKKRMYMNFQWSLLWAPFFSGPNLEGKL